MNKRAEQKALEAYPISRLPFFPWSEASYDTNEERRMVYKEGYEQSEKDFITLVKQYLEKGERCVEQEGESQIYAFWDGFHNCAENILRELEK